MSGAGDAATTCCTCFNLLSFNHLQAEHRRPLLFTWHDGLGRGVKYWARRPGDPSLILSAGALSYSINPWRLIMSHPMRTETDGNCTDPRVRKRLSVSIPTSIAIYLIRALTHRDELHLE
ncbi:hypothetical protein R1flu_005268 [Riccia fluitans]|uniref:Uncharacterized protein n=1 Tax=Riccia fluitans TaxID=41844 RepID=A0ABD1YVG5_9MARC